MGRERSKSVPRCILQKCAMRSMRRLRGAFVGRAPSVDEALAVRAIGGFSSVHMSGIPEDVKRSARGRGGGVGDSLASSLHLGLDLAGTCAGDRGDLPCWCAGGGGASAVQWVSTSTGVSSQGLGTARASEGCMI